MKTSLMMCFIVNNGEVASCKKLIVSESSCMCCANGVFCFSPAKPNRSSFFRPFVKHDDSSDDDNEIGQCYQAAICLN